MRPALGWILVGGALGVLLTLLVGDWLSPGRQSGAAPRASPVEDVRPPMLTGADARSPSIPPTPLATPTADPTLGDAHAAVPELVPTLPGRFTIVLRGLPAPLDLNPLPQVVLTRRGAGSGPSRLAATLGRDADPITFDPSPGAWDLGVSLAAWECLRDTIDVPVGPGSHTLDAQRLPALIGRCVDDDDRPIPNARVVVTSVLTRGEPVTARATSEGTFFVPFLSLGALYDVVVDATGFGPQRLSLLSIPESAPHDLGTLRLSPVGSVRGIVVHADGTPAVGCTVAAEAESVMRSSVTDATGAFAIAGIPFGSTRVWTESPDHGNDCLVLPPSDTRLDLRLVLLAGAWIDGTVSRVDGSAASDLDLWGIRLADEDDGPARWAFGAFHRTARTGSDGAFRVGPFPPGDVEVIELTTQVAQVVRAPGEVHLTLPAPADAELGLTVVERDSGRAASGRGSAVFSWEGVHRSSGLHGGAFPSTLVLDDRGFGVVRRRTPAGVPCRLAVLLDGYEPALVADVDAALGGGNALVVTVDRSLARTIDVRDADGAPVADAAVQLVVSSDRDTLQMYDFLARNDVGRARAGFVPDGAALRYSARTDRWGAAILRAGPRSGPATLVVDAPGFRPTVQPVADVAKGPDAHADDPTLWTVILERDPLARAASR